MDNQKAFCISTGMIYSMLIVVYVLLGLFLYFNFTSEETPLFLLACLGSFSLALWLTMLSDMATLQIRNMVLWLYFMLTFLLVAMTIYPFVRAKLMNPQPTKITRPSKN